jgi:hypothetical protein
MYPGENHGLSRGNGSPESAKMFFENAARFLSQYIATRPVPLDSALVKYVPASQNRASPE